MAKRIGLKALLGEEAMQHRATYRKALEKKLVELGIDITKLKDFRNWVLEIKLLEKVNGKRK